MSPSEKRPRLKFRLQVKEKIIQIKEYIEQQRHNDPQDLIGWKASLQVLEDLDYLRDWPWIGRKIKGLGENYRQWHVGDNYIVYYYVEDPESLILIYELRHTRQKSLKPSTLRKYKREAENQ
jgi:plasmid stabilization system protein ParE